MDLELLFEERNGGLDIHSVRTNPMNELDKEKHLWPGDIRKMQNVWGKR